jgi:hypothetical protein
METKQTELAKRPRGSRLEKLKVGEKLILTEGAESMECGKAIKSTEVNGMVN